MGNCWETVTYEVIEATRNLLSEATMGDNVHASRVNCDVAMVVTVPSSVLSDVVRRWMNEEEP